jgi:hypothetical protein
MHKIKKRFFYHGAPCTIESFDYKFTNQGNDQYGSGFYFTPCKTTATSYCIPNGVVQANGIPYTPTLHKVRLNLENPLDSQHIQPLTLAQCIEIITRAPDYEEVLGDYYDLGRERLDVIIRKHAKLYSANDETPLLNTLNLLANDHYGDNIRELNTVLKDVLGYDGVVDTVGRTMIAVAWFPEQIEFVQRIKNPKKELEEEGPTP